MNNSPDNKTMRPPKLVLAKEKKKFRIKERTEIRLYKIMKW